MISQIKFSKNNEFYNSYIESNLTQTYIRPLSRINFFIGPNNSGKSRLIRQLIIDLSKYEVQKPKDGSNQTVDAKTSITIFKFLYADIKHKLLEYSNFIDQSILKQENKDLLKLILYEQQFIEMDEQELLDFYNLLNINFTNVHRNDFEKPGTQSDKNEFKRQEYLRSLFGKMLGDVLELFPKKSEYEYTYVPSFRTLRKFLHEVPNSEEHKLGRFFSDYKTYALIDEELFKKRVQFDYFANDSPLTGSLVYNNKLYGPTLKAESIFTGETLYKEIKSLRNSGEKDRKTLTDFESFLSKDFFNSKHVSINALDINNIKDVYIKIGSEKEFPIYQLGDGIQAIILLTFPLFINKNKKHLIFYEEPEIFLHPGMQRIFVEVLGNFINTQAFIATHSNHLLDTSLDYPNDISIFSVRKSIIEDVANFQIENLSSPGISILNELGVRNSSVLLANCSIWVEGVSDRMYLKRYIDLYQTKNPDQKPAQTLFKEDLHYSFFEYGGNNIVHYNFSDDNQPYKINALKLSNRIFLVHDRDQGKEKRHEHLKKQLQNNYYELDVLEIENLLSLDVLRYTLNDFKTNEEELITFPSIANEEYTSTPLGLFVNKYAPTGLRKIFTPTDKKQVPRLYNKVNFAHTALGHINTWEDLSAEAQHLTMQLYSFIERNHRP